MVQVKKPEVRQALLDAARTLFVKQGYVETQLAAIAKEAGTSKSNVYKYFTSKFMILMELYDPWLRKRMDELEASLPAASRKERMRVFFRIMWDEIPLEDNGFANLLMQALATGPTDYSPDLLHWFEDRIGKILHSCVGNELNSKEIQYLAELTVMVHDGFLSASRIKHVKRYANGIVDLVCDRLFATSDDAGPAPAAKPSPRVARSAQPSRGR